ncbi:MAG: head-tail adaptor protein [Chlorobiaceae bacterium]|nr:head-tail adaptor protein [Chlorobiaceae bacterium]
MSYRTKTYDPGRFDIPITIKRKSKTQNEYGEEIVSLVTVTDAWAEKELQQAREFRSGNAGVEASKKAQVVAKYTFRFVSGLAYDMIILDGDEEYNITKIADKNRQQYSEVIAQTNVN